MSVSHHNADESSKRNPRHEPVWVQCDGYRCLAVQDRAGQWRTYFSRTLIEGVIRVLLEPDSPGRTRR